MLRFVEHIVLHWMSFEARLNKQILNPQLPRIHSGINWAAVKQVRITVGPQSRKTRKPHFPSPFLRPTFDRSRMKSSDNWQLSLWMSKLVFQPVYEFMKCWNIFSELHTRTLVSFTSGYGHKKGKLLPCSFSALCAWLGLRPAIGDPSTPFDCSTVSQLTVSINFATATVSHSLSHLLFVWVIFIYAVCLHTLSQAFPFLWKMSFDCPDKSACYFAILINLSKVYF